jgi:hypothetical protein
LKRTGRHGNVTIQRLISSAGGGRNKGERKFQGQDRPGTGNDSFFGVVPGDLAVPLS